MTIALPRRVQPANLSVPVKPDLRLVPAQPNERAQPFLKWVGGKTKLLSQLDGLMPRGPLRYAEPFVGGGAVFYWLWSQGRLDAALLCDLSPDVVAACQAVRDEPEALLQALERHEQAYMRCDEEGRAAYFYAVRERHPADHALDCVARAARMIFLNRTCFNGLWRENSRGRFNSPHGRYPAPRIVQEEKVRAAHGALQGAEIRRADFRALPDLVRERDLDFVYLDPPYHPVSVTSSFNAYSGGSFSARSQAELADVCRQLDAMNVRFLLSNSDCDLIRGLYRGFRIDTVLAPRSVNARGSGRGDVGEVAISNRRPGLAW